jgi:hypothetical protein
MATKTITVSVAAFDRKRPQQPPPSGHGAY